MFTKLDFVPIYGHVCGSESSSDSTVKNEASETHLMLLPKFAGRCAGRLDYLIKEASMNGCLSFEKRNILRPSVAT